VAPNVVLINLVIKNGVSLDVSLAGAITVRLGLNLNVGLTVTVSLQNIRFLNIAGGAILIDCSQLPGLSTPSSLPTNSTPGAPPTNLTQAVSKTIVQVQLLGVVFINIALKPALEIEGEVQVQLTNCQFHNVGLPSGTNSSTPAPGSTTRIVGACINVLNVVGVKATVTLSGCLFANTVATTLIDVSASVLGADLIFVGVNTFLGNDCSDSLLRTNIGVTAVLCLGCSTTYTNNNCPTDCKVSCSLLSIGSVCPDCLSISISL